FDADIDKEAAEQDADKRELAKLAEGLAEEESMWEGTGTMADDDLDDPDDEVDAMQDMTAEEREQFMEDVRPVKLVMAKLRKFAFKVIHSTNLLLPAWKSAVADLRMPFKLLPRDVRTRWNSTFDMLDAVLRYRAAIDQMCSAKKNGL
ncbi:hypothetical protein C8Q80DRAFT_1065845, partial [Daedaleopsis nitida]